MASRALTPQMTDEEFDQHIMGIIARKLGPAGLARFIALHRSGPGDYTADRHKWQADLTLEDIIRDLEAQGGIQNR